jgi:hypothetical protein
VSSRRARETAYGELVAGLLDVRHDPATERFDAELAAAEQDGRVDLQTAKVLRWWQREALRSLVEHARQVVPPTLMALETAEHGANADAVESSQSWARAVGDDLAAPDLRMAPDVQIVLPPVQPTAETRGTSPAGPAESAGSTQPAPPTDLSEHRRRLLVAGLTRMPRD